MDKFINMINSEDFLKNFEDVDVEIKEEEDPSSHQDLSLGQNEMISSNSSSHQNFSLEQNDVIALNPEISGSDAIPLPLKEEPTSQPNDDNNEKTTEFTNGAQVTSYFLCNYCSNLFEEDKFYQHVCEYNAHNCKVTDEDLEKLNNLKLENHPCIKQLQENNENHLRILEDSFGNALDTSKSGKVKSSGPYECTMCDRKFVRASGLSRHMEKHAMDLIPITKPKAKPSSTVTSANDANETGRGVKIVFECLICGKILFNQKDGIDHLYEAHENVLDEVEPDNSVNIPLDKIDEIIEMINKLDTSTENDVNVKKFRENPLKVAITKSVLQCEFCDCFFSNVSDLLLHSSKHDPSRRFQCSACNIIAKSSKEIFFHWQTDCAYKRDELKKNFDLEKYFVCNVCDHKFPSIELLHAHRYATYHFFPRLCPNTETLNVCCEYCGLLYDNVKSLLAHNDEKHRKKGTKRELNSTTSTKYRQFLCDVCGKSYTQSSHLWQHLRFHKGVKPFACEEPGCNRRFTIRPDLNDHIRKCHTGERPYHCLVCGKRFLTGSVYYQHRLIHRGERRYGCNECGKRFYRADALKNHQRIHTGEKPYPCLYCSKCFRQRGDRDKHTRARHGNLAASVKAIQSMNNAENQENNPQIRYVNNIPFPMSMFEPVVSDIDAEN